jgi:hypothetical protein
MNTLEKSLVQIYEAFNRRDMDIVLAAMHPAVDWPNGWEGGRVTGRDMCAPIGAASGPCSIQTLSPFLSSTEAMAESPCACTKLSEIYQAMCSTMVRSHMSIPSKAD